MLKGGNSIFLLAKQAVHSIAHEAAQGLLQELLTQNLKMSDLDFLLTVSPARILRCRLER